MDSRYKSQDGQDKIIAKYFKRKENGFFIELGACDGIIYSNSYYFEKCLNWNGLLIEPNPIYYEDLINNRSCYISNELCGEKNDEEVDFILADSMSGVLYKNSGYWVKKYNNNIKIKLKTKRINNILKEYDIPKRIDFLSLDVEGYEMKILKTFPFNVYDVEMICVEHNSIYEGGEKRKKIEGYLNKYNYIIYERGRLDDFYVKKIIH